MMLVDIQMFYSPAIGHGLSHDPFTAIVSPRPIGWISTRNESGGDNIAPYSFFNAVAYAPPQVMFASTGAKSDQGDTKDTVANIRNSGVFCVNIVGAELRLAMNQTAASVASDVDEFALAGLLKAECKTIACPRVALSPANLECRLTQMVRLPGQSNIVVFGEVTGVHLRDDCIVEGLFDVTRYHPVARLGYQDYAIIDEKFSLSRPK